MFGLLKKRALRAEHDEVERQLSQKESELREHERRVQVLKLEAGLYGLRRGGHRG